MSLRWTDGGARQHSLCGAPVRAVLGTKTESIVDVFRVLGRLSRVSVGVGVRGYPLHKLPVEFTLINQGRGMHHGRGQHQSNGFTIIGGSPIPAASACVADPSSHSS